MKKLELRPEIVEAIDQADAALAEIHHVDQALTAQIAKTQVAKETHEAAANALASLEADLALQTDSTAARSIEARVKKTVVAAQEALTDFERQQRVETALASRLSEAEAGLVVEINLMQEAVNEHGRELTSSLATEIRTAAQPLISVLRRMAVLLPTAPMQDLMMALMGTTVLDPNNLSVPIVKDSYTVVDGGVVSLTAGWESDKDLAAERQVSSMPMEALARLKNYRTRAQREEAVNRKPYVRRGSEAPSF